MIFDDEGLAKAALQLAGEQAGGNVSGTAGPERNDDPDRMGRIIPGLRL